MSFIAKIGQFTDSDGTNDRMHLDKSFSTSKDYTILSVKNEGGANPLDLQISIQGDSEFLMNANYVYIEHYARYYFIKARNILRTGVVVLQLHEDVLTTRKDMIRASKGQLIRSENKFNLLLVDNRMPRPENAVITTQKFPNTPFTGTLSDVIVGILGSSSGT